MRGYDTCFFGPVFSQLVRDPEDLKIVFNAEETFDKHPAMSLLFRFGLLSDNGEVYKQQRKALTPLFTLTRLRSVTPIINTILTDFFKDFEAIRKPEDFDVKNILNCFTARSTLHTIFNVDIKDYDLLSEIVENNAL